MTWPGTWSAVLALLLAGCMTGPAETTARTGDSGLNVGSGGGVVQGVITDERIVPVAGVDVVLVGVEGARMTTAEDGVFRFSGLPDGAFYIQTQKRGFMPQQVELPSGRLDGPTATISLRSDLGVPFVAALVQWTAFLQCSVAGINPCYLSGSDNMHDFLFADGKIPDWVQAEALWKTTNALGEETRSSVQLGWHEEGSRDWKAAIGEAPVILTASRYEITSNKGAEADRLTLRLFSGDNVAANQKYEIYATLFYGFTPHVGWSFALEGICDPPESCD